jgi:hypothetical protein
LHWLPRHLSGRRCETRHVIAVVVASLWLSLPIASNLLGTSASAVQDRRPLVHMITDSLSGIGIPERSRTSDLQIRRPTF